MSGQWFGQWQGATAGDWWGAGQSAPAAVALSGAAGRRGRRKGRRVEIRGQWYDSEADAFEIAEALREWIAEIEARNAPAALEHTQEVVEVKTDAGVVVVPTYAPIYAPGEFADVTKALKAINARAATLRALSAAFRRSDEDDEATILLLH